MGLATQQLQPAVLDLELLPGRPEGGLVEKNLAGLRGGLDPAAVVTAGPVSDQSRVSALRIPATTSPVAIPMRTWSGSPAGPSALARACWIARAQWAARSASSSCPCGQPNTANTASPMNFSRVPSNALIASTIARSAASTLWRTSSGSCSATRRT